MRRRAGASRIGAAAAVAVLIGSACSAGRTPGVGPPGRPDAGGGHPAGRAAEAPRCEGVPGTIPAGMLLVGARDRREVEHVGVHRTYRDRQGRRLDLLVGVAGEVGEGLPVARRLRLARGAEGRMLGAGRRWVLVWQTAPPCGQAALVSEGRDRTEFVSLVRRMGLLRRP